MAKQKKSSAQKTTPQLSLFDFFETQHVNPVIDNHKTENDDAVNYTNEGQHGNDLQYSADRRSENEDGTEQLYSPVPLGHPQRPTAATISAYASTTNTHTNAEYSSEQIQRGNVQPDHVTGVAGSGGEGASLEQTDSHAQLVTNFFVSYTDFIPDKNGYKSFSKVRGYKANIEALKMLSVLLKASSSPTTAQQKILSGYIGFGGLKEILLHPDKPNEWKDADLPFKQYVAEINSIIKEIYGDNSDNILRSIQRSTQNAHYTSPEIINAIYYTLGKIGFHGGEVLEPSAGIGNFLIHAPENIRERMNITTVEKEKITGDILSKILPYSQTYIKGFENTILPDENYDLIISNVPFGDIPVFDQRLEHEKDKRFQKSCQSIHNYFFAKSLLLAKPNGIIAFITSKFALDSKENKSVRELINEHCYFLTAYRLPNNAFYGNAGTQVVTDIVFLLKKDPLNPLPHLENNAFIETKTIEYTDKNNVNGELTYNEFYHHHPENILGELAFGGLYSGKDLDVISAGIDLNEIIKQRSDEIFPEVIIKENSLSAKFIEDQKQNESRRHININKLDGAGNLVVFPDGYFGIISYDNYKSTGDELITMKDKYSDKEYKYVNPIQINRRDVRKLSDIIELRRLTKLLLFLEVYHQPVEENEKNLSTEEIRERLRSKYFLFVKRYGHLNDISNRKLILKDSDAHTIFSLEKIDRLSKKITPSDILYKNTIQPAVEVNFTEDIDEAVFISLTKHGKLNMQTICLLMGKSVDEIMATQQGDDAKIFLAPDGRYCPKDEYLSGNVLQKLREAEQIAQTDERFVNNVEQLKKVQPKKLNAFDIDSPLHARWISQDIVKKFVASVVAQDDTSVLHIPYFESMAKFSVNEFPENAEAAVFATRRRPPKWIFEHVLNGVTPRVTYMVEENGKELIKVDHEDTLLAKEQCEKLKELWNNWKYKDEDRRNLLEKIYNELFNNNVNRNFDGAGQKMHLPGLTHFSLNPHQKDGVFRNLCTMSTILDHKVGSGKTLIQICTSMELKRLGLVKKPMIIGLKSQVPDLYTTFKTAYPLAQILFPSEKDFEKKNRKQLLSTIATNDWDCIILSHEQFNKIPQPLDIQQSIINDAMNLLYAEIDKAETKKDKRQLQNRIDRYEKKLNQLLDYEKDRDVLNFKELGIDFLTVDESQEFKNLEFITNKKNVRGLGNPKGSKRAFNLKMACRYLQQLHKGDKGIIFSSGTPISNSISELFLLFDYLTPTKLQQQNINTFDKWAAVYANDYTDLEYYMGKFKEIHRIREFVNLPELINHYRSIADVRNDTNLKLDKPREKHELIKIEPTPLQLDLIEKLQAYNETKGHAFAEELGLEKGKGTTAYSLLAINFASKLSLDPRMIHPAYEAGSKIKALTDNVFKCYHETEHLHSLQLIFLNLGTPKSTNTVENLHEYLSSSGIMEETDFLEIFGSNFENLDTKPSLEYIKLKMMEQMEWQEQEVDMLLREANGSNRFIAYDAIKNELVRRGIPEKRIVYIHDFKTARDKMKLYDLANSGEISVMLGSTVKMGVGINVQRNCYAIHTVDMPYRPSDLEQQNGRGIRQGNEIIKNYFDNEMTIYYYAVNRTLDAYKYKTVSNKSKFIQQLKCTDNIPRTINDIIEDIDLGTMSAELSGDPIYLEKAQLEKKIPQLTAMQRSHVGRYYNALDKQKQLESSIEKYHQLLDKLVSYQQHTKLFSEEDRRHSSVKIKVNDNIYDKPKETGTALFENFKRIYNKAYNDFYLNQNQHALYQFYPVGTIDQCRIEIQFAHFNFQKMDESGISTTSFRVFHPDLNIQIGYSKKVSAVDTAFATQVLNSFFYLPAQIDKIKEAITGYEQELKTQQEILKIPIQNFDDEIQQLKKRLNEVNEIILNKVSEKNKNIPEAIKEKDIQFDDDEIQTDSNLSIEQDIEDEFNNSFENDETDNSNYQNFLKRTERFYTNSESEEEKNNPTIKLKQ